MFNLIENFVSWGVAIAEKFGYWGIFMTMALESAAVPIPSEVVLPFGGFLSASGKLNFWLVVVFASLANLSGSIGTYFIGFFGGRPFLEKYGRYFLIHGDDLSKIDRWLRNHGSKVAF